MKRKLITMIIICSLLVSFSINVFSNNEIENSENNTVTENITLEEQKKDIQDKIEESNNRLKYVQSELTVSLQKIQELDDSIVKYSEELSKIQDQTNTLEKEIEETDKQLAKNQEEYKKKENLFKRRVVALYEAGETTYLDVLLSSKGLMDFLSNYYMIEEIMQYDNELLQEVENRKNEIETQKNEQEKRKSTLKVAKAQASRMQILMENNKLLQQNYLAQLTDEEKELNEKIEAYKQEEISLENQILAAINWGDRLAIQYTGGAMIWPVGKAGTYITSGYGNRLHPIQGVYKNHSGIDIGNAGYGAPVVAAADGVVTFAGVMGGYGNCVMINHGDGIVTLYGHGQEVLTTLGTQVSKGDVIMLVGSTGNSTGPHLHFEVRKNGIIQDPIPYLKGEENK